MERLAKEGENSVPLPKCQVKNTQTLQFSYSGLKTAVINYCHNKEQKGEKVDRENVACSFQHAAVDPLVKKTVESAVALNVNTVTAGGGVIANGYLRARLGRGVHKSGTEAYFARKEVLHRQRGNDSRRGAYTVFVGQLRAYGY